MTRIKQTGVCALTGVYGAFAQSHIIPKAFIRRVTEAKFAWVDDRGFVKKAPDAFRDDALLTLKGEKITADYDNSAIRFFRHHRLTYASRRNKATLEIEPLGFAPHQFIALQTRHMATIRLFGLSLMWRAAASNMPDFAKVVLSEPDLEELRCSVAHHDERSPDFFPTLISVFDSKDELAKIGPAKVELAGVPFYRFFLDGVVLYVSAAASVAEPAKYGRWLLGSDTEVHCLVLSSEGSFQQRLGREGAIELFAKFPNPWPNLHHR